MKQENMLQFLQEAKMNQYFYFSQYSLTTGRLLKAGGLYNTVKPVFAIISGSAVVTADGWSLNAGFR